MTKKDFERNKPYTNLVTEIKKRMKEELPKTNFISKFGKIGMLRRYLHKKQIKKELASRPEHLSPAKVKNK